MGEIIKKINYTTPSWYKILMWICTVIFIVAFFLPPMASVDPSVIQGISVLIIGGLIGLIPYFLAYGKSVRVTKGDTSISIEGAPTEFSDEESLTNFE